MDESKYYTPEIEEFHVGFECEFLGEGRTDWISVVIDWANMNFISFYENAVKGKYRVKYLDREDIEGLGWRNVTEDDLGVYAHKEIIWRSDKSKAGLIYVPKTNWLCVTKTDLLNKSGGTVFAGVVKNKSELKKLMKMLGI